jgi:hypothetical protein
MTTTTTIPELVLDKDSGRFFHLSCKPGAAGIGAALAGLSGLGA